MVNIYFPVLGSDISCSPHRGRTLTTETKRTLPEEGAQIVSPHDSKLKFKNKCKAVFHFTESEKKQKKLCLLYSLFVCLFKIILEFYFWWLNNFQKPSGNEHVFRLLGCIYPCEPETKTFKVPKLMFRKIKIYLTYAIVFQSNVTDECQLLSQWKQTNSWAT